MGGGHRNWTIVLRLIRHSIDCQHYFSFFIMDPFSLVFIRKLLYLTGYAVFCTHGKSLIFALSFQLQINPSFHQISFLSYAFSTTRWHYIKQHMLPRLLLGKLCSNSSHMGEPKEDKVVFRVKLLCHNSNLNTCGFDMSAHRFRIMLASVFCFPI